MGLHIEYTLNLGNSTLFVPETSRGDFIPQTLIRKERFALAFPGVGMALFLQPYGRKKQARAAFCSCLAQPSRGSSQTFASGGNQGNPSRFLDGAFSDLRQAGLPMRPR